MPTSITHLNISGLNNQEVLESRMKHGLNQTTFKKENGFTDALKSLSKEPMVLLLLVAAIIYFMSGKMGDGLFLSSAIILVAAISLYQDRRSRNALEKLKDFTRPCCHVIRNGEIIEINTTEVVLGDYLMVEEGISIAADAIIVHSNDFSVNESILTGESLPVYKDVKKEDGLIYHGTTVSSGLAIARVIAIGNHTRLGKIGQSLQNIQEEKTPLEKQINNFVKKMVMAGTIVFIIVWGMNYFKTFNFLDSLLKALTLAMSILPEEIPVAFTTFMALGAWRLMKLGIVVKQMKTVETLGSATVICTDKTGTITENKMTLSKIFILETNCITPIEDTLTSLELEILRMAMFASEPIPFDPMEISLHQAYGLKTKADERPAFNMIHEYPLGGQPPMMTHCFEKKNGDRIVAAKGAPEALIAVSDLKREEESMIMEAISHLSVEGYRILGVGVASITSARFPETQQEIPFRFLGLIAFHDPPKQGMKQVLNDFYNAGITVKIITGDNAPTTAAIAHEIGFRGADQSMSGEALMLMDDAELQETVSRVNVFTRMFPEAKLRIINALKANQEIVAMTGDGVNDGPALKAANIGIAMGKKGTEIAKQAASLILLEDDLSQMVDAIAMGRRIYTNLKKAIQYVISIHIPIILTVFIPLLLGWVYPNLFSPVHIIFLELIMGPTCSIIYENEPMEKNTMLQKPRPMAITFFKWGELYTSILQGLMITVGTLFAYQYVVASGLDEATTRTSVFAVLISSNIFLTLVNRSFYFSMLVTLRYKNNLVPLIIGITLLISGALIYIKPLASFFQFTPLTWPLLLQSMAIGGIAVLWFELVKGYKRWRSHQTPLI